MSNIQTGAQRMPHDLFHLGFFFNDTATTEIYTLSLHDALPISLGEVAGLVDIGPAQDGHVIGQQLQRNRDRKSTRLYSSHTVISYADFCLKQKFKLAPSVCRMTFPILTSLLVRLVVLLPFQLLRLSLATPSRWTPLALSVFLHCVVALLLTLL